MLTIVSCSSEQIEKIYNKHLKPLVFDLKYSYDDEDEIGFVSAKSIWGAKISFQMRRNTPCFFGLVVENIRYDVNYPKEKMKDRLTELGLKASKDFWEGGQI